MRKQEQGNLKLITNFLTQLGIVSSLLKQTPPFLIILE